MPLVQELTAKVQCENWFLAYGLFWISCFADTRRGLVMPAGVCYKKC